MKPVNLAAKLAAAETELACVRMVLAHVKLDRDELRQERDEWRREAEMLGAAKLIIAKLREADEPHVALPERRPWWCVASRQARNPGGAGLIWKRLALCAWFGAKRR